MTNLYNSSDVVLNWAQFYNLAQANYDKGGDAIVNSWDEDTFCDWIAEGNNPTPANAFRFFRFYDSVRNDLMRA